MTADGTGDEQIRPQGFEKVILFSLLTLDDRLAYIFFLQVQFIRNMSVHCCEAFINVC